MHLLAATPGSIEDGSEAVDLGQSPGDIVVLSAADTELACLSAAWERLNGGATSSSPPLPSWEMGAGGEGALRLRLANLLRLGHHMSVDLYVEKVIAKARLVVVRLLGGRAYWPYGVEQFAACCRERGILLAFLPGDDQPDADLAAFSTLPAEALHRLWQYLLHGGLDNAEQFLRYAASLLGEPLEWREPRPLPPAGLLDEARSEWREGRPVAALVFYRALVQSGDLAPVTALQSALRAVGMNVLPVFVTSLKDPVAAATVSTLLAESPPDVILCCTGFAVSSPGRPKDSPFAEADCPVLQVILSGGTTQSWREGSNGLSPRDIAMNVALPEVDGRIVTRAVSFKQAAKRDRATEADVVRHAPEPDRIDFAARLAANWARLRRKPAAERRIALVLANYPNRDGRLGNGVGLDTPAGTVEVLRALGAAGYRVEDVPEDGDALVARLLSGPTNDHSRLRAAEETLPLPDYYAWFHSLPESLRAKVQERWGPPERDPFFRPGELHCGGFAIPAFRCGNVAVAVQPARGYNIDPAKSYHDPALVPPHGYLAFYAWLQDGQRADAVVHMGKHGNLEWLPGKALALSSECFPEAALGPLPHLYPFIVNDPGEGTQAKRRAQAVIIDHLTPPLTRAETYGPLRELERLVDEYYEAANVDPRRLKVLEKDILTLLSAQGLDIDCGITPDDPPAEALRKLDAQLCELKEMQIRDGLHIFGRSPEGEQATGLLVALARPPRGSRPEDQSLIRALAEDLDLRFDPLDCDMAEPWDGPRPEVLEAVVAPSPSPTLPLPPGERETGGEGAPAPGPWRSTGDTVERLELLAHALVAGTWEPDPDWPRARAVLSEIESRLRPGVASCGGREVAGLLAGLAGRFVEPGPSGAPTRGRPDVLPTGRNFYSVDTRTVPTPAAWQLGWRSATMLVERHLQEHGEWPRAIAVTAWGTSNMRTGGDDVSQALALMGVRPTWDSGSRRVTGFEIMPAEVLDRPRVDVTLRVSGFFRDAFPALIDLFDSAARAVAALDEPAEVNPLAERARAEAQRLVRRGIDEAEAKRRATFRVFGSKPGAYGAGLQALIDERGWETDADLARAYVAWGGWAYGAGAEGEARHDVFEERLRGVQAVVQNQDNREHDLLDSDDYYQFEGGMAAAVRVLSGAQPAVYHPDHSRPETPRIRTLEEEISRVVRARVVNPKWIAGAMRHGYKGGFEMAATVDYLFAFAATARCVKDHHFDLVADAYLRDDAVRRFLEEKNPDALREMAERLIEAQERGLWRPRANDTRELLDNLSRKHTP